MIAMNTVLLIEDAEDVAYVIGRGLQLYGFTVQHAADGAEGLVLFKRCNPDVVILDWMLPKMDGIEVLRNIRQESAVPVLMLTARDEETDRVTGLDLGADDYLPKPFGMSELAARIQALLRRAERPKKPLADKAGDASPDSLTHTLDTIQWRGLTIEPRTYRVTLDNTPLELTHTEFELLRLMMGNPGRTFTRKFLVDTIWEQQYLEGDRSVDNAILRLRRKLGPYGKEIESVRSAGYRWKGG